MFIWGPVPTAAPLLMGAAPIDLQPQEGAQVQAGDQAAITQVHVVAPVEGAQVQVGDPAAIAVTIPLYPQEGAQVQAGDSPALAQVHALAPQEGAQEQVGDAAALSQVHALAPQEGVQVQAGDVPPIAQQHQLAPAEGAQDQVGDSAPIAVVTPLYPTKGTQDQAGDSSSLTQLHVLSPQEGAQEQFGDGIQLDLGVEFYPTEGSQDQHGDSAKLIVGVLTTHEFVNRLLLEERIKAIRLAERTVKLRVEPKVALFRPGRLSGPVGAELVDNNGWESWTAGEPDDWACRMGGGGGGGFYEQSSASKEGSSCIRIWTGMADEFTGFQEHDLVAGRVYRISAWLKPGADPDATGSTLRVSLSNPLGEYLQEDGSWTSGVDNGVFIADGSTLILPQWTYHWREFVAPYTGPYRLYVWNDPNEYNRDHRVDTIHLFEVGVHGFVEKVRLHDETKTQRLGRFQ